MLFTPQWNLSVSPGLYIPLVKPRFLNRCQMKSVFCKINCWRLSYCVSGLSLSIILDCRGDNKERVLKSCCVHSWSFCRIFYHGQSSQSVCRLLGRSWPSVWTSFTRIRVFLLSAGSKTSPRSRSLDFFASLLWIVVISETLHPQITHQLLCGFIEHFRGFRDNFRHTD